MTRCTTRRHARVIKFCWLKRCRGVAELTALRGHDVGRCFPFSGRSIVASSTTRNNARMTEFCGLERCCIVASLARLRRHDVRGRFPASCRTVVARCTA